MKQQAKAGRRVLASALAACMGLSLAACGGEGERVDPVKEWVYVPEFLTIEDESVSFYDMRYHGDGLYYFSREWDRETYESKQSLCKYSLTDKSISKFPIDWGETVENNRSVDNISFAGDGSIYVTASSYIYDEKTQSGSNKWGLAKFSADGKLEFFQDVTDKLKEQSRNEDYFYINSFAVDDKGRMYVVSDSNIYLFDGDCAFKGTVSVGGGNSWIQSMGTGRDGKVYVCCYSYDGGDSHQDLFEIDFDNAKTGVSYGDFPRGNGETLTPGAGEGSFLVNDGRTLYEYDLATQTENPLFDWLDSDIDGSSVRTVGAMEDGRVLAVIEDWENNDRGVALLTKTKGSEVAQKETILVGALYGGSGLQSAAVKFNRSSDKYHVSIRQYEELANLNNDLISKVNCPDILDLSGLNIKQLAAKGLLEDLGKYLDKSSVFKRDDFLENILNAYTYDGVLTCIPMNFEMGTITGRASEVGTKMGWTLQELMDYAGKHPGAEIFDRVSKDQMMYYLMAYNEDAFIDWSTGKCNFNSEEFKNLLAFANSFPTEIDYESGQASTPTRIQNREVLLDMTDIYNFNSIQVGYEIFEGDMTCIGFPTADGSNGTLLMAGGTYAITTKATRKDGAWEFFEFFLQQDNDRYSWGFPTKKAKLDEMAKKAVTPQYITDENGKPILDENGEPIETGVGGGFSYEDGWSYRYRRATQEEVDLVLQLMDVAKPITMSNSKILEIIQEEAAPYFEGQKTLDDVVKVIQGRVQNYVDEGN